MACAGADGLCRDDCLPRPLLGLRGDDKALVADELQRLGPRQLGNVDAPPAVPLVTPARFERATFPLGGGRSIQLSYGAIGSCEAYRVQLNGPSHRKAADRQSRLS